MSVKESVVALVLGSDSKDQIIEWKQGETKVTSLRVLGGWLWSEIGTVGLPSR